jgi:cytochrome oxidase Cu insertion factor (SCO1/SenC/PrrC family)
VKTRLIAIALASIVVLGVAAFLAIRTAGPRATPHQTSTLPAVGVAVGNLAPDFQLTDVFGRSVNRSSLVADRPGLLFFTTTYCLPCVEGLRVLARYQSEVGMNRFNVLVAFVDPSEPPAALRTYQEEHGLPQTWFYALDTNEMVAKYHLRALDTKYVLDRAGVIHFTDLYPATYETWRQALALVGVTP